MAEKKIFVGNGRQVTSWKRGISICLDDVKQYATVAKKRKVLRQPLGGGSQGKEPVGEGCDCRGRYLEAR